MKERKYQNDFFNVWRAGKVSEYGRYYWLQLDYDFDSREPFHICFENNNNVDNGIFWPVFESNLTGQFPYTNVDFRSESYLIKKFEKDDAPWSPSIWSDYLFKLQKKAVTYEDFHRRPKASCVDIDAIEVTKDGSIMGVETTSLEVPMTNKKIAIKLFRGILEKRFFINGFHQLAVQNSFLKKINARHYLVVYNEVKVNDESVLHEDGNSIVFLINDEFFADIQNKDADKLVQKMRFMPFSEAYKKIINFSSI